MTGPLVDPNLAELQAGDPAAFLSQPGFLERADVAELGPQPLETRQHIARDLAIAVVVVAALVVRELHRRRAADLNEATEIVQGAWKQHLPAWIQLAAPAIRHTYRLGAVQGSAAELDLLSREYARDLGNYVGQTSGEAMLEGLNRQLNQRWSFELAWHRAAAGYGLDKRQMTAYLAAAAKSGEASPELVPAAARTMIDRLLLTRATRIGGDQAYTAEQTGKSLLWMKAYADGRIPDALRQWTMGRAEEHCGICSYLRGQKVAPDQPFILPNGQPIWAPRVHPGCDCHIVLLGAEGETIAKGIRRETVHRSQVGDHVGSGGYDTWSATHSDRAARDELNRRRSRTSRASGAYREREVHMGPVTEGHRPIGHLISEYRPLLSRKRVLAAGAGAALVGAAGIHHQVTKRAPIAAGAALVARDTGRVLMLQRALDSKDPAGGTWEFPGGHIEPGEDPLTAAKREWSEEVRRRVPLDARYVSQWVSPDGKYVGAILTIPAESEIPTHRRGRVTNPDDPDGDQIEAIAWWDVEHMARNPALRSELRSSLSQFRDAIRDSRISKAFGDDPATRDSHGRFATHEGRRTAVLDRPAAPDPGMQQIARTLQELEAKRAAEPTSRLTGGESKLASRSRLAGGSKLGAESRLGPMTKLTQQIASERKQELRQRAPMNVRITLKLPKVERPPAKTGYEGLYVPQSDVQDYFDDAFGGAVGAFDSMIHFGDIAEYYQSQGPTMGDYAHGGQISAFQEREPYSLTIGHGEMLGREEWEEIVEQAEPVWDAVIENSGDILEELDSEALDIIMQNAIMGEHWDPKVAAARIDDAINSVDRDDNLRDAFADYVTFTQPELLDQVTGVDDGIGTELAQTLAGHRDHFDGMFGAETVFRVNSLANGDSAAVLKGDYDITHGEYLSAITAKRQGVNVPSGHIGLRRLDLSAADPE